MNARLYELTCQSCQSKWMVKVESIVNANIEKNLKNSILDSSYFHRKCSCCGNIISFYYPFLYCDIKHKALIVLLTREDEKWVQQLKNIEHYKDFTLYEVDNETELKEYIILTDHEIDIHRFLELKQKLSKTYTNITIDMIDDDYVWLHSTESNFGVELKYVK